MQGGAILEQEDAFGLGIMDGLLFVGAVDWCAVKFNESTVGRCVPDRWYTLALVYDGSLLTVYLNGEKKDTFRCKHKKRYVSDRQTIGNKLDAYIKTFRFFDKALSDEEIGLMETDKGKAPKRVSHGSIFPWREEKTKARNT